MSEGSSLQERVALHTVRERSHSANTEGFRGGNSWESLQSRAAMDGEGILGRAASRCPGPRRRPATGDVDKWALVLGYGRCQGT